MDRILFAVSFIFAVLIGNEIVCLYFFNRKSEKFVKWYSLKMFLLHLVVSCPLCMIAVAPYYSMLVHWISPQLYIQSMIFEVALGILGELIIPIVFHIFTKLKEKKHD